MYAALARAVLDEADGGRALLQVERLRQRYPHASRDELARRLIHRTALQCAGAGALLTSPAAFFGAMPFGADLAYQAMALNRLVLSLAGLYRRQPSVGDRATGIAAGLAASLGSEVLRQGVVRLLRQALGRRAAARSVAGALVGGAIGYGAALAIGRLACDVFAGRRTLGLTHRLGR